MTDAQKSFDRPLSPHLRHYRLPMAAVLSITHRITGVGLSLGCVLVAAFFVAAAMGQPAYDKVQAFAGSIPGTGILYLWSFALYYHLCNGVRHLIWDTVHMLGEKSARLSGWIALFCAAFLTTVTWLCSMPSFY